jgi:hypothetical protein
MKSIAVSMILLALAGCSALPRDPDGTTDRVVSEHRFRVGMIAGGAAGAEQQQALLARIAGATGSRPQVETGSAEALLLRLEEGTLDLVLGEFDSHSPWVLRAHLLPPLLKRANGNGETHVTAAARHGENRWIMLIDREARALGGAP